MCGQEWGLPCRRPPTIIAGDKHPLHLLPLPELPGITDLHVTGSGMNRAQRSSGPTSLQNQRTNWDALEWSRVRSVYHMVGNRPSAFHEIVLILKTTLFFIDIMTLTLQQEKKQTKYMSRLHKENNSRHRFRPLISVTWRLPMVSMGRSFLIIFVLLWLLLLFIISEHYVLGPVLNVVCVSECVCIH